MIPYAFHPDAQAELNAQRDYYDECEPGLGSGFVQNVFLNVMNICAMPYAYPEKHGVRHCYMSVFPFDIIFEELDGEIVIWAVAHTRRMPVYWRERVRKANG